MHAPHWREGRVRVGLAAALAASCLVSACTSGSGDGSDDSPSGSPTSSASSTGSSSASPTDGPVTLRLAVYGGPEELRGYRAVAKAFTAKHPAVAVRLQTAPDEPSEHRRLERAFRAGDAPDLFLTDASRVPSLTAEHRTQPVDELLDSRGVSFGDNYERLGLEAMAGDSALQCMPSNVSPYVVFYNRRLLDDRVLSQLGGGGLMPSQGWTWDQFVAAARLMSQGDVKGVYLSPRLRTLTPLLRSAGVDIVDDPERPTTLTLSDPATRRPLQRILAVARDSLITPTRAQLAEQDAVSRFERDKLGMLIGTRALVPRLRHHPELPFDVAPLPSLGRFSTVADVSGYCIIRASAHVSAAADFLAFASRKKGAELTAATGAVVPANLAALRSDSFTQVDRFPLSVGVFSRVTRRAQTMPAAAAWPAVVARTQPLVRRLFYGRTPDLDQILPRMDQVSQQLLAPTQTPSSSPSD